MVDRYTKFVLTVIATALTVIAIEQTIPRALAVADCGYRSDPCYVTGGISGVDVNVTNWPIR